LSNETAMLSDSFLFLEKMGEVVVLGQAKQEPLSNQFKDPVGIAAAAAAAVAASSSSSSLLVAAAASNTKIH
jgi:hypothetical protein